jgi:hypothetical protein
MELPGTPDAGYERGASPKTTPNVKTGIAVQNMSSAMLKSFMKRRMGQFISGAELLALSFEVLTAV